MFFFFFNDTATTEIYTLSLHDALPIFYNSKADNKNGTLHLERHLTVELALLEQKYYPTLRNFYQLVKKDRKSTRLNSSHGYISYAVFCLKKKKKDLRCVIAALRPHQTA